MASIKRRKYVLGSLLLILTIVVITAIVTKPDDKTIKKEAVSTVWGRMTPPEYTSPGYYNQFMNLNAPDVYINDWLVLKRIQYKLGKETKTIGYAAFGKIIFRQ